MRTITLFNKGHLSSVLDNCLQQLHDQVYSENQDYLLNVNEEEYVNHIVSEFTIDSPSVQFEDIYADQTEKDIPANRHPSFGFFPEDGKSYKRQVIIYYLPFSGDTNLLEYMPNPAIMWSDELNYENGPEGEVLNFEIINFSDSADDVKSRADQKIGNLKTQLGHIQNQVNGYNSALKTQVEQVVQARKKDILKKSNLLVGLGIPIKKRGGLSETFSIPSPALPKKIIPRPYTSSAEAPEPTIAIETYDEILKVIHDLGTTIEKMPSTYEGKGEENLRDHFLMYLEPRFEGSVTGETFNKTGKTDILFRYQNSNVFIAECKFWNGESKYLETIDQILKYLTWRDSKAALIIFVENTDFSSVIQTVKAATPKHPNFVSFDGEKSEGTWQKYKFNLNGDRERKIFLNVLLFHYPAVKH